MSLTRGHSQPDVKGGRLMLPEVSVVGVAWNQCQVQGALTFETALVARDAGLRCFAAIAGQQFDVSCAKVTAIDSAGLAVLIDWLAHSSRTGRTLSLSNLPEEVRALARISDLEALLGRKD